MQATFFKRTISRILLSAGLIASLIACKKDKNNDSGNPGNPGSSKIASYTNGEDYAKFDYNADGSVKTLTVKTDDVTGGDEVVFNVKYDAQKRISKLESDWQSIEVEYTGNVMSRSVNFSVGQKTGYTNYLYTNGNLENATLYYGEAGTYLPVLTYSMTYTGQGLLKETIVLMATEPDHLERAGAVRYEYDEKTNPLYEHRQLLSLLMINVSKNNITVENHLDADLQPEDKFQYTYTYNAKGLPEKAIVKQGLPGSDQSESQLKFTYK